MLLQLYITNVQCALQTFFQGTFQDLNGSKKYEVKKELTIVQETNGF